MKKCPRALAVVLSVTLSFPSISEAFSHRSALAPYRQETGTELGRGWVAEFGRHTPGYLLAGFKVAPIILPSGTYSYTFFVQRGPGHLRGLFSGANEAIRLEVFDLTTGERIASRAFQENDFGPSWKRAVPKRLLFSTWGRSGHLFEPRVYWPGLVSMHLMRVDLETLDAWTQEELQAKALRMETLMQQRFLDDGYVVMRDNEGHPADLQDTALWTGLYAATECARFQATHSAQAHMRMENALWALHRLHEDSPTPGTLVRYANPADHTPFGGASKDTYTGFFFAVGQCWPWIQNPRLRAALQKDVSALAAHFLDHDLNFVPLLGKPLDLNPYFSPNVADDLFQKLSEDAAMRRAALRAFHLVRYYFRLMHETPPATFSRVEDTMRRNDRTALNIILIPLLNDTLVALHLVALNVERSTRPAQRLGLHDSPYQRLLALLNIVAARFEKPAPQIQSMADLKILPSQSLLALHILKVAGVVLPRPNRFNTYYEDNLFMGKDLLGTALDWAQWDELLAAALFGESQTARVRGSSNHLPYLALLDLETLDPARRADYLTLFERHRLFLHNDLNAMTDIMAGRLGIRPDPTGMGYWTLHRYPENRRGFGETYWQNNGRRLAQDFGGWRDGYAADPIPPDLRPRDAFLWQRNAHSIRGDSEGWEYAPLDYLWVFWMSQSARRAAVSKKR